VQWLTGRPECDQLGWKLLDGSAPDHGLRHGLSIVHVDDHRSLEWRWTAPGILSDWLGLMSGRAQVLATGYRLGDLDDPPQVRCPRQEPLHIGSGARRRIGT
jgi:hypothetical protein